jgi:Tetracyclin repressor-like, C-terminal domain
MAAQMVERAIDRGEVPPGTDPRLVIEGVIAPIYFRLLMSRERLSTKFVKELARLAARGAGARQA